MMRMTLCTVACILVGLPLGAQSSEDGDRIRALRAQSNDAIARHDVSATVSFLDDEFQGTGGGGSTVKSAAEMEAVFTQQFSEFDDLVYVRNIESVETSSAGPFAAEIGAWVGNWTAPSGPVRMGGRYAAFWRQRDGVWLIRSELFVTLFCEGAGCS